MADLDGVYDTALLLQAQAGDPAALGHLINRHDSSLRYFVRRLLEDPIAADDVVQDVWLATLRQVKQIRSGAAFRIWLYRVARNRAMSHLRREVLRRACPIEAAAEIAEEEVDFSFPAEAATAVHQAMQHLSVEHREVLTLRFMENMSYEDMAAVTECTLGTVRSRLHYAKRQIERVMRNSVKTH
jgi:RNA polymerase sigma-70 factor (ECF subfamily)